MQYSGSFYMFLSEIFSALPSVISSYIIYVFAAFLVFVVLKMFNQ